MIRFLKYLRGRPLGLASLALILLLYLLMAFAEFIAPYSPTTSFEKMTYHPPNLRFQGGHLLAQEARVLSPVNWRYALVKDRFVEVKLFAKGEPYKLWGLIPMRRHLFTTVHSIADTAPGLAPQTDDQFYPIFLMGADHLGRDLFSRIVYGSRISLTIGFIATAISLLLAMLLGGLSGYFGAAPDWLIMRL
jgi:peptide/nickel transport system permease protein